MKELIFLTLFPEQISFYINQSIPLQAQKKEKIYVKVIDIRKDKKTDVDDYAFGGGGMVLKAEPIINLLKENNLLNEHIILLSPRGKTFCQSMAVDLSKKDKKIVFICGHYEGVDERICDYITEEISIGDFLLSSGEIASLIIADAVIRLMPGVINPKSLISESFNDGLLDYPAYTRPSEFDGKKVPEILLSGDHQKIEKYREDERIRITKKFRPDLYKKYLSKK